MIAVRPSLSNPVLQNTLSSFHHVNGFMKSGSIVPVRPLAPVPTFTLLPSVSGFSSDSLRINDEIAWNTSSAASWWWWRGGGLAEIFRKYSTLNWTGHSTLTLLLHNTCQRNFMFWFSPTHNICTFTTYLHWNQCINSNFLSINRTFYLVSGYDAVYIYLSTGEIELWEAIAH